LFLVVFFNFGICNKFCFFDENTLHNIYINKGEIYFSFILNKVIFTSTISYILKILLCMAISTEKIFLHYKKEKYPKKSIAGYFGLKCAIFFGLGIITLLLFWIYIFCFFGVFTNIKFFVLETFATSFALVLIIPFFIDILPTIFRSYSLSEGKNREYSYKFSKIIQYV